MADHAALAASCNKIRETFGDAWRAAKEGVTQAALLGMAHTVLAWNDEAMFLHAEQSDQGDFLTWSYAVLTDGTVFQLDELDDDLWDFLADIDTESGTARGVWQRPEFCEIKDDRGGYYAFDVRKLIAYFEEKKS